MRYDAEQDPKKPHPMSLRRKGDNPSEAQEHQPHEVVPDASRDRHLHVRVPPAVPVIPQQAP